MNCPSCGQVLKTNESFCSDCGAAIKQPKQQSKQPLVGKQLMRSKSDRQVAGVCGGVANYLDMDPSIVRILWILFCLAGGSGVLVYIVMAMLIPEEE